MPPYNDSSSIKPNKNQDLLQTSTRVLNGPQRRKYFEGSIQFSLHPQTPQGFPWGLSQSCCCCCCRPHEMFTFTCNPTYQQRNPLPLSASGPNPLHLPDAVQMSQSLHLSGKVCMFPSCKDDGEDKQHKGERRGTRGGGRRERARSPVVLLERPFIRCSSCWAIYFSILLAMSLSYGLADLWAKEMSCLSVSLGELDLFSFSGGGSGKILPNLSPTQQQDWSTSSQTVADAVLHGKAGMRHEHRWARLNRNSEKIHNMC